MTKIPTLQQAALGLFVAILCGCSSSTIKAGAGDVVELRVFDRITTMRAAEYSQWLVTTFNQRNRGKIHATWSATEDETFKPKINIVLRSRTAPDIFFTWEGGWAKYMIESGYATSLDQYYEKYHWEEELNRAGTYLALLDNHRYFVPTRMAASVVWYRPDIFEQNGLHVPTSWSDMVQLAQQLQHCHIIPFLLANQKRWPAQFMWTALFVNNYGVEAYNKLLDHRMSWSDPKVVETFRLMKKLSDDGLFEPGANALDITPAVALFASGKAAMWYQGSFLLTRFMDQTDRPLFPFDFFQFPPIGQHAPTTSVFVEDGLMINRHTLHPNEAAAFLDWAISEEAQKKQLELGLPFPSNVNVPLGKLSPVPRRLALLIAKHSTNTFTHIDHAVNPALSNPFLDYLQAVLAGVMSPDEAAAMSEKAEASSQGGT